MVKKIMRQFKILEVSAVDRPAQKHARVVLMKRDSIGDTDAEPRRNNNMTINCAKQEPSIDAVELKKHYNAGDFDEMTKEDWGTLIDNEAKNAQRPGESFEEAFTRLITEDPAGREAWRAYQSCESRAMYKQVFGKSAPSGDAKQDYVDMRRLAAEYKRKNPGASDDQAYSAVLRDTLSMAAARALSTGAVTHPKPVMGSANPWNAEFASRTS